MKAPLFSGVCTAIITPFKDGKIDFDALGKIIDLQINAGVSAIVVCGTTGESSTLTDKERLAAISFTVRRSSGLIKVIAGTGTNCTEKTLRISKQAQDAGADGLLIVTPYYNKTTQSGLIEHFGTVAKEVTLPILLYNVPSRTGMTITPETYKELSKIPNIIGTKEASGNIAHIRQAASMCRDNLIIYSGNDADTIAVSMLGGKGVISVASNIMPKKIVRLCALCQSGDYVEAMSEYAEYSSFIDTLFCEVNPIPIKAAMALSGLCSDEMRLPLVKATENTKEKLSQCMQKLKLSLWSEGL